jgi:DnaK suppressor protein
VKFERDASPLHVSTPLVRLLDRRAILPVGLLLLHRETSHMDEQHARQLLTDERAKVEALLLNAEAGGRSDRAEANDRDGMSDGGERLTEQYTDDAVAAGMRARLAALDRAERRLEAGTYGRSIRSGQLIPDERLEADPAAELTLEEAEQADEPGP